MKKRKALGWCMFFCIMVFVIGCGKKNEVDVDLSAFETPVGFEWAGTYIDDVKGIAVLNIEKDGNQYSCMITVPTEDVSHIDSYQFTAKLSKEAAGLAYTDGTMTTMDLPDFTKNPDGEIMTAEVYTDGSGVICYLDGFLYWIDDKEDAGKLFAFRALDETEDNSGSGETGTEDNSGSGETGTEDNSDSGETGSEDNSDSGETGSEDNSGSSEEGLEGNTGSDSNTDGEVLPEP